MKKITITIQETVTRTHEQLIIDALTLLKKVNKYQWRQTQFEIHGLTVNITKDEK